MDTEMDNGFARVETDGHRADVILQRAGKRNALIEPLMQDLTEAFRAVDRAEGIRAAVMLGEGPVLSAGMDLEMMRGRADDLEAFDYDLFPELLETIEECRVPTVAAIHGAAPAGAFELTLPFDFRLLGADADYGVIEVQLGTFPHGGATQRLPRLIGLAKAKELVLGGEFVDPEEARDCGLVNEVVEPGEVKARARAFADGLIENAPLGMERAKTALNAALDTPLAEGLQFERALGREMYDTRDFPAGIEARQEGRQPAFEGR
jgi:enoyl-CoA hydratase/carnithine racemase